MSKNYWNPKLRYKRLNQLIKERYKSKSEFARQYGFKVKELINWTLGISSPNMKQHVKLLTILDLEAFDLYLPPGVNPRQLTDRELDVEIFRYSDKMMNYRISIPDRVAIDALYLIRYDEQRKERQTHGKKQMESKDQLSFTQ